MHQVGSIAAFVLAFVWLLPWSDVILRRHPKWNRVIKWIVFSVYVLANLRETLLFRKVLPQVNVRLTPFHIHSTMLWEVARRLAQGVFHWKNLRGLEEILLNILLYVPLGYLLPWIFPKLRTKRQTGRHSADFYKNGAKERYALLSGRVVLVGMVCTLATEIIQWSARIGTFEVDDLINNTLGCMIGCVLYELAVRAARKIGQRKRLRTDET